MAWILANGLHCKNSAKRDPNYVEIGNHELIGKRSTRVVDCHPGGTLSDYIPFYFTPFSPMLYNIKTGWGGIRRRTNDEIVIVVSSLPRLVECEIPFLFTDRHAYLEFAQFSADLDDLEWIDWPSLQARNFSRRDVDKFEQYQAEALVHRHLPVEGLIGLACHSKEVAEQLNAHLKDLQKNVKVAVTPGWYFQ